MDDTVVSMDDLRPASNPLVWQCGCGNQSFLVYQDGSVECSSCADAAQDIGFPVKPLWPDNDR